MPADVLSEATRHAERLVELAPGNPASHELRSYVHMHDAEQDLDVACGYALPSDCHPCSATLFSHIELLLTLLQIFLKSRADFRKIIQPRRVIEGSSAERLPQGPSMWLKHASHNLHATNVQTVPHNKGCAKPKGDSDSTNGTFLLVNEGLLTKQ